MPKIFGVFVGLLFFTLFSSAATVTSLTVSDSTIFLGESTTINIALSHAEIPAVIVFETDTGIQTILTPTASQANYSILFTPAATGNYKVEVIASGGSASEYFSVTKKVNTTPIPETNFVTVLIVGLSVLTILVFKK